MPRATNGVYTLPNTVNPVVVDTIITANWANTTLDDLASVITSCLDRAGRGAMQANLAMGSFKITGLADGVSATDAATVGQAAADVDAAVLVETNARVAADSALKTIPNAGANLVTGEMYVATAGFTLNTGLVAGTVYPVYNNSASAITLTQGSGVTLRLAGTTLTGNRTLAARGQCSIWALSTSEYIISGAGLS